MRPPSPSLLSLIYLEFGHLGYPPSSHSFLVFVLHLTRPSLKSHLLKSQFYGQRTLHFALVYSAILYI